MFRCPNTRPRKFRDWNSATRCCSSRPGAAIPSPSIGLKRRRPGFNESYYGFESFSKLLEEAQARGQLDLELDERSGSYIIRQVLR